MSPKPSQDGPALVWFRDDLRLSDQPALAAAAASGRPLLCIYILDQASEGVRPLGAASRWWLHFSLADLTRRIAALGSRLDIFEGAAADVIPAIVDATAPAALYWTRRYGLAERNVDAAVADMLQARGIAVETFNGRLVHEPAEVRSKTGTAFRVFTPFLRASLSLGTPDRPSAAPETLPAPPKAVPKGRIALDALDLLPTKPDWAGGLRKTWTSGESAAQEALHDFVDGGLHSYGEDRNRPALPATSRLSPHLRFGEISPGQMLAKARHAAAAGTANESEVAKFVSEVIWRDFAHNLLVEHPDMAENAVQPAFRHFPYKPRDDAALDAWHHGRTGYPIVDAGMRELWHTGVMHNRVRMITASFLIKHLLMDWRLGEQWFWDTLCDADPASNAMNWQWVAGCGADPAPYFRIFNPTLQGEKFDGKGDYVRRFVPELADMPAKWIHQPWEAPPDVLAKAGVVLGRTYPRPIVEHEVARERALKALASMRHAHAD